MRKGTNPSFTIPEYAHHDEAYGVAHINVEIGANEKTGVEKIDAFNQLILNISTLARATLSAKRSTLSLNVWFEEPELVDGKEWAAHVDYWRQSLMVYHTSPGGDDGIEQTYFDQTPFIPLRSAIKEK